jgi:cell wall assembly regulator SMI1
MKDQQIIHSWARIEQWLQQHAPAVLACLANGATINEIQDVEHRLNISLPNALVTSLQIHDGQIIELVDATQLNSCRSIIECWESWEDSYHRHELDTMSVDAEDGILPVAWNPKWIPITYSASGSNYFIDLDPDTRGNVGQVIHASMVDIQRWVAATDFSNWLKSLADSFELGRYELSRTIGGLVKVR